jgi:hypothetical protein
MTGTLTIDAASANLIVKQGRIAVGTTEFTAANPEKLIVDAGTASSLNIISGIGNYNNYIQLNIKNKNSGNSASSDLVATADNGDETTNYVDLGINSSTYNNGSYTITGTNDAYLYNMGQNFSIGTGTAAKVLKFHTGGTLAANEAMRIDSAGNTAIGTTSATSKLTVAGTIEITSASGGGIKFKDGATIYSGSEIKGATFIYPFMTAEASIHLPYNATITSFEVMVEGLAGSSVTGRLSNNALVVASATVSGNGSEVHVWGGSSSPLANTTITAYQNLEFEMITVTGRVYTSTIQFYYKQNP